MIIITVDESLILYKPTLVSLDEMILISYKVKVTQYSRVQSQEFLINLMFRIIIIWWLYDIDTNMRLCDKNISYFERTSKFMILVKSFYSEGDVSRMVDVLCTSTVRYRYHSSSWVRSWVDFCRSLYVHTAHTFLRFSIKTGIIVETRS